MPEGNGTPCPTGLSKPDCQYGEGACVEDECHTFYSCETCVGHVPEDGVSVCSWSDQGCELQKKMVRGGFTTPVWQNNLDRCEIKNQDCEEMQWSECTAACETADERSFTLSVAPFGDGIPCPDATDCANGDGACVISETDGCHIHHNCWDCVDGTAEDGVSPCGWSDQGCKLETTISSGGVTSPVLPGDFGTCETKDQDCVASWSECTSDCETKEQRTFTMTQAPFGDGESCPRNSDCTNGDGACVRDLDCEWHWRECTAACEKSAERFTSITKMPEGNGTPCPTGLSKPDCQYGEGACVEDECHTFYSCETCVGHVPEDGVSVCSWSDQGCELQKKMVRGGFTTPVWQNNLDRCEIKNQDCEEMQWSECTAACETADERSFTLSVAPFGDGIPCPDATDCANGDGACVISETDAPTTIVEVNDAGTDAITDPCLCPEGKGWSRTRLGCFEDSTTACDECPTMEGCQAGSCAAGCYGYMPMRLCQCTPSCLEFGNCCQDSQPCMTCQEQSWCSENIPCNGLCAQQNSCPCTCGHIPTQSPSPSPTATVCDVSQEQDFCQDVPCEELCDSTLCPCTCPDVGTRNNTTMTPDETLMAMEVIPNPFLQTITKAVKYPLALCGAFASLYYIYQFIHKQTSYTEVQDHEEI